MEMNYRKAAKLQELKGLLKLLETLTLQYNRDKQYELIVNINAKVSESLASLLTIYRSVNLDILRSRSYLERIPSKPELLFVQSFGNDDS